MEKSEIEKTAGEIWRTLDDKGEMPLRRLVTSIKNDTKIIYLALGWLARENKVTIYNYKKADYVCLLD
jgi:hypothetical protein